LDFINLNAKEDTKVFVEDFIEGEETSILRNPLIANTLYLGEYIEKWGSGLKRIYEACIKADVRVEFKKSTLAFLKEVQKDISPLR
jgi:predicted HTH transcriptional regulator